jgi:hypothetical protein
MSFQNVVRLSQIKKMSLPDCAHVNKVTINVIQHDYRLLYLGPFCNGAFSILSKHDFDDQVFLFATVHILRRIVHEMSYV